MWERQLLLYPAFHREVKSSTNEVQPCLSKTYLGFCVPHPHCWIPSTSFPVGGCHAASSEFLFQSLSDDLPFVAISLSHATLPPLINKWPFPTVCEVLGSKSQVLVRQGCLAVLIWSTAVWRLNGIKPRKTEALARPTAVWVQLPNCSLWASVTLLHLMFEKQF